MLRQRTSVGLDVHARSVVACGLDRETGEVVERRLTPDHQEIMEWISGLPAPVAVTYEAGPTGRCPSQPAAPSRSEESMSDTPAVESKSIDWIPLDERGGGPSTLFPLWFMSNANLTTLATACLG